MADNKEKEKDKFILTPIKTYVKFHATDKTKNKKLMIQLFQATMNFKIFSSNEDGKFKDKPDCDIYLTNCAYNEDMLYAQVLEIIERIKKLNKGETMDSTPLMIHNGKPNYDTATSVLSLDCYTKEGNIVTSVEIKKKDEKSNEWVNKAKIYLSNNNTPGTFNKSNSISTKENYLFFLSLSEILKGMVSRTSTKRDEHWRKYLEVQNPSKSNNGGNSASKDNIPEIDEDDEIF